MSTEGDHPGVEPEAGAEPEAGVEPEAGAEAEAERPLKDFSAGGVVVRDDEVAVIVPKRRGKNDGKVLGLPKGHLDGDETEVEAAVREVREETGVTAEPVSKLGEIRYSYERRGQTINKRVAFYLLEYRSGELDHDHEIEQVQWMPLEEALRSLTYSGEREMVARALSRRTSDL